MRPVCEKRKSRNVPSLIETLNQEKHDSQRPNKYGRPVCGHESTKRCVLTPKHVEDDQTDTERPVLVDHKEEHDIDFRVPGLSHAVKKDAEHLRVQELVKKIENHPHREALHADLQENNAYNPFSKKSKAMIRELRNTGLFELCETSPKVQCSHCLLYWNQGFMFCTCGQFLVDSESRKKVQKTKIGCSLYPELRDQERAQSWCSTWQDRWTKKNTIWPGMRGRDAARKSTLKVNFLKVFQIDFSEIQFYRESQLVIGWTEQKC